MMMSEEHVCFRMLCFHVSQARFTVSAEKFVTVSFLTYVIRSYENDRGHVAASERISQSLQLDGGLVHLSPGPIHVCGGVQI